jgi:hypothetical protein
MRSSLYDYESGASELCVVLELAKPIVSIQAKEPVVLYFSSDLAFTSDGFSIKQVFETKKLSILLLNPYSQDQGCGVRVGDSDLNIKS